MVNASHLNRIMPRAPSHPVLDPANKNEPGNIDESASFNESTNKGRMGKKTVVTHPKATENFRLEAEAWMRGRLSTFEVNTPLSNLGLDSLDLVQLRNAFNRNFQSEVPLSVFSNATQTLDELLDGVAESHLQ